MCISPNMAKIVRDTIEESLYEAKKKTIVKDYDWYTYYI